MTELTPDELGYAGVRAAVAGDYNEPQNRLNDALAHIACYAYVYELDFDFAVKQARDRLKR